MLRDSERFWGVAASAAIVVIVGSAALVLALQSSAETDVGSSVSTVGFASDPNVSDELVRRNPLAGPLPDPLASLNARIEDGEDPSQAALVPLIRYARENPGDCRANLMLAHTYARRRWLSHSLPQYFEACLRDAACRHYPPMLPDLIEMVRSRRLNARASTAIVLIYRDDALPAVIEAQSASDPDSIEAVRLRDLRTELEAL